MSRRSRVIDGVKLVESAPGAPLPPGMPANAERCDIVEMPDLEPRAKSWIVGLGAAGVAMGAAMTAFLTFLGIPVVFVSLVALYHGLVPGTKTVVTPSPRGGYLAFEADPDEARREEPFRFEIVLFVGIIFVMNRLIEHFADRGSWVGISLTSLVGVALLYFGSRREEWDASELAASLRFRALADPARPLDGVQSVDRHTLQEPAGGWLDSAGTADRVEAKISGSPQGRSQDSRS